MSENFACSRCLSLKKITYIFLVMIAVMAAQYAVSLIASCYPDPGAESPIDCAIPVSGSVIYYSWRYFDAICNSITFTGALTIIGIFFFVRKKECYAAGAGGKES